MAGGGVDRPPYQVALRLYAIAEQRWPEVDAQYPSIDLIRLPADRFCNFVYRFCLEHLAKPEAREEFDMRLKEPLPWDAVPGEAPQMWSDEDEAATWAAAMSGR